MRELGRGGYVLGRGREHSVRRKLLNAGWLTLRMIRSAGGLPGSEVKPIDLVALKNGRTPLFIQVSKYKRGITREEINELEKLASMGGALPVLCWVEAGRFKFMDTTQTRDLTEDILKGESGSAAA